MIRFWGVTDLVSERKMARGGRGRGRARTRGGLRSGTVANEPVGAPLTLVIPEQPGILPAVTASGVSAEMRQFMESFASSFQQDKIQVPREHSYLEQFQRYKHPTFPGILIPSEAEAWFKSIEKTLDAMMCPNDQWVTLAAYLLHGEAEKDEVFEKSSPFFRRFLISSGVSTYREVLSKALALEQNDVEDHKSKDLRSQQRHDQRLDKSFSVFRLPHRDSGFRVLFCFSIYFVIWNIISHLFVDYKLYLVLNTVSFQGHRRAFCIGGDVAAVARDISEGHWRLGTKFFWDEFSLNYLMATYRKPQVSILNGIVMGGGAGASLHGRFRVATENTVFAMLETTLGLFPDVGASYFISRLPGFFGEYAGLIGPWLDGAEMLACGLATHFVPVKDTIVYLDSDDPITIGRAYGR
ncbi:hypothetical protein GIB67_012194, partial [Kingdonia uniflora]